MEFYYSYQHVSLYELNLYNFGHLYVEYRLHSVSVFFVDSSILSSDCAFF